MSWLAAVSRSGRPSVTGVSDRVEQHGFGFEPVPHVGECRIQQLRRVAHPVVGVWVDEGVGDDATDRS